MPSPQICVFLDAEIYIEHVHAPRSVARLIDERSIPPTTCVYLSFGQPEERHTDFTCNAEFTQFLVDELLPWISANVHPVETVSLYGLSLSGLAALYAATCRPTLFPRVLSQSPSAWWNHEWLSKNIGSIGQPPTRIWLSVGDQELESGVNHGPTSLFQGVSQLDSCRNLARALDATGQIIHLNEFSGSHDPSCWARELPMGLAWLLQDKKSSQS